MTRYLLAALAAAILLAGFQSWRVDRLKAETVRLKIEVATLTEFKALAMDDAQTQADQCTARVADARASARRIETIVERPVPYDAAGCPVRSLVSADDLRGALQPHGKSGH